MSVFYIDTAKLYVQLFKTTCAVYSFIKVLIYVDRLSGCWMVAYESLKTKEKSSWVITKVVMVSYGSGRLRELFITNLSLSYSSNGVWLMWSQLELVAYESGRKESFDCTTVHLKDFTYASYNDAQIYAPTASCCNIRSHCILLQGHSRD